MIKASIFLGEIITNYCQTDSNKNISFCGMFFKQLNQALSQSTSDISTLGLSAYIMHCSSCCVVANTQLEMGNSRLQEGYCLWILEIAL